MARPTKSPVFFTTEALQKMLQNIWNEAEETGVKATSQYGKQTRNIVDNQDIALVSKINAEYLKIRDKTSETKLSVARLVKDIVYKDSNLGKMDKSGVKLDDDDKAKVFELIKRETEKSNRESLDNDNKK